MKLFSTFKIGIFLLIIASIWIVVIFSGNEKISQNTDLGSKETAVLDLDLSQNGIGYYVLYVPNYSKDVLFVQITDPDGNVIEDKKIETKMAVNYFKFSHGGPYSMKITNFSGNPVKIEAQFGDAQVDTLLIPLMISLFGAGFVIFSGYKKLSNQSTAHPEENPS